MRHERREKPLASPEYRRLAALSAADLERIMIRGDTPDADNLVGWEYRGYNPKGIVHLVGIRKFVKGFYRDDRGRVFGYNETIEQDGLGAPWTARPSDDAPRRFGFFRVTPVDPTSRDNAYLHALLLDYSRGGNLFFDPTNVIRDYLVRVEKGSDDLLLGKAYVALGPLRPAAGYFLLERHRPTDWRR